MYDDLKTGFTHLYIQPCYVEDESVEENGKSFQIVERLVKDSPGWRLSLQTQVDGSTMNRSVMSLSGGMDSTALLLRMIAEGDDITCISYDYGQKHIIEIDRARDNISYLRENGHNVEHFVVDLNSAMQSLHSALTSKDIVVPEGHYESEQMKQTVVPNRNAIFSSILYARALSTAISENCQVRIGPRCA